MSTYDPSSPESEGGGKPSFDKQPPQAGTPSDAPPGDQGAPGGSPTTPPNDTPPPNGSPYGGNPYGAGPYGGSSYGEQPGYQAPRGGPGPIAGMPPLGGWPNRIVARLIDYLIIQAVAFLVILPFTGFGNRNGWTGGVWLYYGLYLIYEGVMLSRDGQTLGKKVMKVRVAMLTDGSAPAGSAAWTRATVYTLPAVLCCGLWWLADGMFGVFDKPYRQCIHDKAAKTVVVTTA